MSTLYTLIGLPASGKSTFTKNHADCVVVSTDSIREELYGNEAIQGDGRKVFNIAYNRIEKALANGHDVIFDATNLVPKFRKRVFDYTATHIAVYFDIDVEICIERDKKRSRTVGEDVIRRMAMRRTAPLATEKFDSVIIIK